MRKATTKLNGTMCRHAFNDAVEALSRVASYTTSRTTEKIGDGEFSMIGPELCRRDLIILAISLRRLAELTSLQSSLRRRNIKILRGTKSGSIENESDSSWNIIGNIIHSSDVEVLKSNGILGFYLGSIVDIYKAVMNGAEIDAVAIITTEKHGKKVLNLVDFCSTANGAIEEMNEFMGDNGVFLGSGFDTV